MSCDCTVCNRTRLFKEELGKIPESSHEYFISLFNEMEQAETDRDYYKVIVDGTWPNADEVIKHVRTSKKSIPF